MVAQRPGKSAAMDVPDSVYEANDYFHSHRYTDGLPVIPPTEDLVNSFVAYTKRDPLEVIGLMPPLWGPLTVEKIAINAVMAGCKPEYMPVVIAAVQSICPDPKAGPGAVSDDPFNMQGSNTTTNPLTPIFFVNGPIRNELEINCAAYVLGPGFRANISIGRAVRLMCINVGGSLAGNVSQKTFAWPGAYGLVIGEFEEESPWEPLHVSRGFKKEDNVITAVMGSAVETIGNTNSRPESILYSLEKGVAIKGTNTITLLLPPPYADMLTSMGFTKQSLRERLYENNKLPLDVAPLTLERYEGFLHGDTKRGYDRRPDDAGRVDAEGRLRAQGTLDDLQVVVAGSTAGFWAAVLNTHNQGALEPWRSVKIEKP